MLFIHPADTETADALADAIRHAARTGMLSNLIRRLAYLDSYAYESNGALLGAEHPTQCTIGRDSSPFSFGFVMSKAYLDVAAREVAYQPWYSGGLIFHGPHDGGGNGSAPTFAVCVEATAGWSVHT